ncbi:hypothetical protein DL93DRAFT_2234503 [Clavulina sp. PMI_390]|nr:hypothetical protein DL93DRAFT_2234503 [Clavulina sp. PMI_390]
MLLDATHRTSFNPSPHVNSALRPQHGSIPAVFNVWALAKGALITPSTPPIVLVGAVPAFSSSVTAPTLSMGASAITLFVPTSRLIRFDFGSPYTSCPSNASAHYYILLSCWHSKA